MAWTQYKAFWAHPDSQEFYSIIRERILPLVSSTAGKGILVLNYDTFSRVRVDSSIHGSERFENVFRSLVTEGVLVRWEQEPWFHENDAHNRVVEAKQKALPGRRILWQTRFGVMEVQIPPGLWETGISDEQLIHDFDELMTKVIGPCANAYVSAFGELPKSEWFISMFIHLLLNAIGCTGPDGGMEPAARLTPAL